MTSALKWTLANRRTRAECSRRGLTYLGAPSQLRPLRRLHGRVSLRHGRFVRNGGCPMPPPLAIRLNTTSGSTTEQLVQNDVSNRDGQIVSR